MSTEKSFIDLSLFSLSLSWSLWLCSAVLVLLSVDVSLGESYRLYSCCISYLLLLSPFLSLSFSLAMTMMAAPVPRSLSLSLWLAPCTLYICCTFYSFFSFFFRRSIHAEKEKGAERKRSRRRRAPIVLERVEHLVDMQLRFLPSCSYTRSLFFSPMYSLSFLFSSLPSSLSLLLVDS